MEYDVPSEEGQITIVHIENEVEKDFFYLVALDCRLRFPLSVIIVEILNVYGVALS